MSQQYTCIHKHDRWLNRGIHKGYKSTLRLGVCYDNTIRNLITPSNRCHLPCVGGCCECHFRWLESGQEETYWARGQSVKYKQYLRYCHWNIIIYQYTNPSKHKTLNQCWFDVGQRLVSAGTLPFFKYRVLQFHTKIESKTEHIWRVHVDSLWNGYFQTILF